MQVKTISRHHVIELAMKMPPEKLTAWYEYGLFIQSRPILTIDAIAATQELTAEMAAWEAASDEDWLAFEAQLTEID